MTYKINNFLLTNDPRKTFLSFSLKNIVWRYIVSINGLEVHCVEHLKETISGSLMVLLRVWELTCESTLDEEWLSAKQNIFHQDTYQFRPTQLMPQTMQKNLTIYNETVKASVKYYQCKNTINVNLIFNTSNISKS